MKTLFDADAGKIFAERLARLSEASQPAWGKMNAAQMLAHCTISMQVPLGEFKPSTGFMTLIGKMMKGSVLGPKPFGKNAPTAPVFKIKESRDFEKERSLFLGALQKLSSGAGAIKHDKHPLLGTMSAQDWAVLHYKHIDHHFRQFGI